MSKTTASMRGRRRCVLGIGKRSVTDGRENEGEEREHHQKEECGEVRVHHYIVHRWEGTIRARHDVVMAHVSCYVFLLQIGMPRLKYTPCLSIHYIHLLLATMHPLSII